MLKPWTNEKNTSIRGFYTYVQKQETASMQTKHEVTGANDRLVPDTNHEEREEFIQEPEGSKEAVNVRLKEQERLTSQPKEKGQIRREHCHYM